MPSYCSLLCRLSLLRLPLLPLFSFFIFPPLASIAYATTTVSSWLPYYLSSFTRTPSFPFGFLFPSFSACAPNPLAQSVQVHYCRICYIRIRSAVISCLFTTSGRSLIHSPLLLTLALPALLSRPPSYFPCWGSAFLCEAARSSPPLHPPSPPRGGPTLCR